MNLIVLTEEDDLIELLVEWIADDVLYDRRETFVFSQHLEVNGIIGREIFVFWFNACDERKLCNQRIVYDSQQASLTVELCLHGELWHFTKLIWQRSHFVERQSLEIS